MHGMDRKSSGTFIADVKRTWHGNFSAKSRDKGRNEREREKAGSQRQNARTKLPEIRRGIPRGPTGTPTATRPRSGLSAHESGKKGKKEAEPRIKKNVSRFVGNN